MWVVKVLAHVLTARVFFLLLQALRGYQLDPQLAQRYSHTVLFPEARGELSLGVVETEVAQARSYACELGRAGITAAEVTLVVLVAVEVVAERLLDLVWRVLEALQRN